MDKKQKWKELAKQLKEKPMTLFEMGVLTGLSSKYDFKDLAHEEKPKEPVA